MRKVSVMAFYFFLGIMALGLLGSCTKKEDDEPPNNIVVIITLDTEGNLMEHKDLQYTVYSATDYSDRGQYDSGGFHLKKHKVEGTPTNLNNIKFRTCPTAQVVRVGPLGPYLFSETAKVNDVSNGVGGVGTGPDGRTVAKLLESAGFNEGDLFPMRTAIVILIINCKEGTYQNWDTRFKDIWSRLTPEKE